MIYLKEEEYNELNDKLVENIVRGGSKEDKLKLVKLRVNNLASAEDKITALSYLIELVEGGYPEAIALVNDLFISYMPVIKRSDRLTSEFANLFQNMITNGFLREGYLGFITIASLSGNLDNLKVVHESINREDNETLDDLNEYLNNLIKFENLQRALDTKLFNELFDRNNYSEEDYFKKVKEYLDKGVDGAILSLPIVLQEKRTNGSYSEALSIVDEYYHLDEAVLAKYLILSQEPGYDEASNLELYETHKELIARSYPINVNKFIVLTGFIYKTSNLEDTLALNDELLKSNIILSNIHKSNIEFLNYIDDSLRKGENLDSLIITLSDMGLFGIKQVSRKVYKSARKHRHDSSSNTVIYYNFLLNGTDHKEAHRALKELTKMAKKGNLSASLILAPYYQKRQDGEMLELFYNQIKEYNPKEGDSLYNSYLNIKHSLDRMALVSNLDDLSDNMLRELREEALSEDDLVKYTHISKELGKRGDVDSIYQLLDLKEDRDDIVIDPQDYVEAVDDKSRFYLMREYLNNPLIFNPYKAEELMEELEGDEFHQTNLYKFTSLSYDIEDYKNLDQAKRTRENKFGLFALTTQLTKDDSLERTLLNEASDEGFVDAMAIKAIIDDNDSLLLEAASFGSPTALVKLAVDSIKSDKKDQELVDLALATKTVDSAILFNELDSFETSDLIYSDFNIDGLLTEKIYKKNKCDDLLVTLAKLGDPFALAELDILIDRDGLATAKALELYDAKTKTINPFKDFDFHVKTGKLFDFSKKFNEKEHLELVKEYKLQERHLPKLKEELILLAKNYHLESIYDLAYIYEDEEEFDKAIGLYKVASLLSCPKADERLSKLT